MLHRSPEQLRPLNSSTRRDSFPDHAYTFKHALTHEVTYESLLRERRRMLHARIVEVIEALDADRRIDQIERLAYHALRGEVWDKAVTYFRQAGVQAAMRSANREAVAGFEQALVALQHLPDTRETRVQAVDLRFDLRNTLLLLGEHEKSSTTCAKPRRSPRPWTMTIGTHASPPICAPISLRRATMIKPSPLVSTPSPLPWLSELPTPRRAEFPSGQVYHAIGAYHRAMACLRCNVESLTGELLYARFGHGFLVSVFSRAWLVCAWRKLASSTRVSRGVRKGFRLPRQLINPLASLRRIIALALCIFSGRLPQGYPCVGTKSCALPGCEQSALLPVGGLRFGLRPGLFWGSHRSIPT